MKIKEIFQDIKWVHLLLGATIFTFIVVLATDYQLEILLMFSSAGLLYIGYNSKDLIQGSVLGAVGTFPLFLSTVFSDRIIPISGDSLEIGLLIISFLAIGAFCGFIGAYYAKTRKKAIAQKKVFGKARKKKKANKGSKNRK